MKRLCCGMFWRRWHEHGPTAVRCLENEGVRTIYGLPGEENMDVLDALLDSSIRFIQVSHDRPPPSWRMSTGA